MASQGLFLPQCGCLVQRMWGRNKGGSKIEHEMPCFALAKASG